jgi:hypothetical protein
MTGSNIFEAFSAPKKSVGRNKRYDFFALSKGNRVFEFSVINSAFFLTHSSGPQSVRS